GRAPRGDRLDRQETDERPLIVLDPGHGGIDTGATGRHGSIEKIIVLQFARRLAELIEEDGRFRVELTRDDDRFIPLGERVEIARRAGADLLLSIHADSIRGHPNLRGATVYTLAERASDEIAAQIADQENASDILAGVILPDQGSDDVRDILLDLTRRETMTYSARFARDMVEEIATSISLVRNPHRSAGFRVLRSADTPSLLLELGFLSNREDERLLVDAEWQARMAEAVYEAIKTFFDQRVAQGPY
ncbi:MAG: N-acetylmuramoyl-L-alanine amidase, partial [Hyphomicrobiaceae bacterium]|nr:N-acetylmuramoyl-L-alanine amidase [Hyphomicrobiaceae bacterium]